MIKTPGLPHRPPIDRFLVLAMPADWARVETEMGSSFAKTADLRACLGDILAVPLSLLVQVIKVDQSVDAVELLIGRRVPRGPAPRFLSLVGMRPARGVSWTDGVLNVCSAFVLAAPDVVVEFSLAQPCAAEPARPLDFVLEELLLGVHWLTPSASTG